MTISGGGGGGGGKYARVSDGAKRVNEDEEEEEEEEEEEDGSFLKDLWYGVLGVGRSDRVGVDVSDHGEKRTCGLLVFLAVTLLLSCWGGDSSTGRG
jgi:hypothetical protein